MGCSLFAVRVVAAFVAIVNTFSLWIYAGLYHEGALLCEAVIRYELKETLNDFLAAL